MPFLITLSLCSILIFLHYRYKFGSDNPSSNRKVHHSATSRLGGVAIYISIILSIYFSPTLSPAFFITLFFPSLFLVFLMAVEDLKQGISPIVRLVFSGIAVAIVIYEFNLNISNLQIPILDMMLENYYFSFLFTLFTFLLVMNAFNVIDGFNGLSSGFSIISLISLLWLSITVNDSFIAEITKIMILVVLGFSVLNFPFGKIFLGDSGAYLLGFVITFIYIYFINKNSLSYWLALGILIYPIFDFVYSIFRRSKNSKLSAASQADALHLHHLIHIKLIKCHFFKNRSYLCNSFTSVFLWIFSLSSVIPSVLWFEKPKVIFFFIVIFMLLYHILYVFLVRKKTL